VIASGRILVLDDERIVRELMVEILQAAGHDALGTERADEALDLLVDDDEGISLIVSDIHMPGVSGFELIEAVRARRPSLPVVLVTGAGTQGNLSEALARGADGLVTKPFTHAELTATVEKVLRRVERSERELRDRVVTPTLAGALANAIEAREASLHGHCERLATVALRIAEQLGLPLDERETIRLGAILHDVGKIGIPDAILLKPGSLTPEEWTVMRRHPLIGDGLLSPLGLREGVRAVVRHHHERWDGGGYPDGLAGEAIPLAARVIAVADSIEAMAADRPYRRALPLEAIAQELRLGSGTQWDPLVADTAVLLVETGELRLTEGALELASEPAAARPPVPAPRHRGQSARTRQNGSHVPGAPT
jgi:putative nucleotidyltransferase with HDIG domain